jgi:hypothetical protein
MIDVGSMTPADALYMAGFPLIFLCAAEEADYVWAQINDPSP